MSIMAEAEPSESTGRDTGTDPAAGFGRFKNELADHLDLRLIKIISNLLELKSGKIERITRSETPGHDMVELLENKEVITATSITKLVNMLHQLNLAGLAERIQKSFQATTGQSPPLEGFGSFKVALADVLTVATVLQLATIFDYPPAFIEKLDSTDNAGILMIRYMEEGGQIKPTSILKLLSALKKMCNSVTEERVKKLYEKHTGRLCPSDGQSEAQEEGNLKNFLKSLKDKYALWYNMIKPIPYIRDKIFCVEDIYVESGLELVHQPTSFKHDSQSFEESDLVSLKSFRDIFDSDIIPSNRILLEGDPGYGKSTLTVQAAYDWCSGNIASPLKNFAVFILLPLGLLGNISSIFEAIRVVLMPPESPLTVDDIRKILRHGLSVVIVLDGYDEYQDKNSVIKTDIMKILTGEMFVNVKVVVSTRSSSLPKYLHPTTVTIRLTGFDEKSRDEYIQRTVTGGDQEASRRITNALNSNPILNDICQVPMFCVLFAHVANDHLGVIVFSSVTSFFKYVIDCFYSHRKKKDLKEPIHQSIREYSKLNRLAFDGLTEKTQMIAWPKHNFIDTVGKDCYEELSYIGIIIVDETHEIITDPKEYNIHHIIQSESVRFYHKLFAEWYAAIYLSSYAGSFLPFLLNYNLNKVNPVDLQFVFRFACGLNKKASSRIIKYLKSVEGGASFASLCFLEQPDNPEEVLKTVRGLCSDGMIIRSSDSRLLQRSNIQLLEIASRKKIQVPCLQLDHSFKVAHQKEVTLESGLSLPVLLSIEKLVLTTQAEHEISQENMLGVVNYGQRCLQLKTLAFHGKCLLPLSLNVETLKSNMNSRSIIVFWQLLEYVFQLDVSSGKWRLSSKECLTSGIVQPEEDVEMLRSVCSGDMTLRCTDSRLLQRANIQFLEIASRHKIPLSCLVLDTFREADKHSITLENGNYVPVLSTLKEMKIRTEKRIEFTQEQIVGLLFYAQQCPKLQKISFIDCLVPLCFPKDSLRPCESDTLKVLWKPREHEFYLNFTRSRWALVSQEYLTLETKDQHSLTKMCSGTVTLHTNDTNEYHMSVILLLQIAASQQIEVPCLQLDHSLKVAQQNEVTLESGLSVPVLLSIRTLVFKTQAEHNISQENMIEVVKYGQRCLQLKTLAFHGKFVLPLALTVETLKSNMNSRCIIVFWQLLEYVFQLDVSSGKWRLSSTESLTSGIVEPVEDVEMLRSVCSGGMAFRCTDSRLLQRANIQFLEIASRHKIPLSCLVLHTFREADKHSITLENGYHVPVLSTLEEIQIRTEKRIEFTPEQVVGLLCYAQQCPKLQKILLIDCLVPLCFPNNSLWPFKSDKLKVLWKPGEQECDLNFTKSRWTLVSKENLTLETMDQNSLTKMCSGTVTLHTNDTNEYHMSVILLLQIAASQQIPLSCLVLDTFREADPHSITLENGNHVPVLSTLEEMQIRTEKRIEFTPEQVVGLLRYAKQCPKLQTISFMDCLVPLCFSNDSLWPCESDTLKVLWKPGEQEFDLNFTRGRWTLESQEYLTLETKGQHSLTKMCSGTVTLQKNDTNENHRSIILLLQIAAIQQIQITSLMLKSFSSVDQNHLILEGRNRLPLLPTLKELQIKTNLGKEFTQDQVIGLFCYAQQCQKLKKVSFIDCLLPLSLPAGSLSPLTKLHDIEVSWKPSKPDLHLDSFRGKWVLNSKEGVILETKTQNSLRSLCSSIVFLQETDSKQLQRSTILLLEIASSHNIPIFQVTLGWSFSKIDEDGNIILSSGLSLPIITSIERMNIHTKKGREMNKHEVNGILNYIQHSQRLKALFLLDCLLPSSIPIGPCLSTLKSRRVNVFWKPNSDNSGKYYELDLGSGLWLKLKPW